MKNILITIFILLLPFSVIRAQSDSLTLKPILVHVQGTTFGIINTLSASVEMKIISTRSNKFHLYGRAGLSYFNFITLFLCDGQQGFGTNLEFAMLTGQKDHHFEMKTGAFIGSLKRLKFETNSLNCGDLGTVIMPIISLGYRYQRPGEGMFYNVNLSPYGIGAGIGYALR